MKTNMVVSGSNPQEVSYAFYNPVNRCLEQASTYEMGMRKPVSFQAFSYIIDRHQNLWYTKGDGFGYLSFHRKKFEYRFDNHKEARALMEDHQKRLWVGWKRNHKKQSSNVCLYDPSGQWIEIFQGKAK